MKRLSLLLLIPFCSALVATGQQSYGDPIVMDLDGKDFDGAFTDVQHGVTFEFIHVGEPIEMAWTEPGRNIGFLVLNRHGDHVPDSNEHSSWFTSSAVVAKWKNEASAGTPVEEPTTFHVVTSKEMFGNMTNQPLSEEEAAQAKALEAEGQPWEPSGYRALGVFDRPRYGGNGDGMIDAGDLVFSHLRVWVDTAHNGRSEDGKMYTLPELGIKYISLNYTTSKRADRNGNQMRYVGKIGMENSAQSPFDLGEIFFCMIRTHP